MARTFLVAYDSALCLFVCLLNFLSVNMSVKRCGGAYGARISRANQIATACALAAYVTKR